MARVRVRACLYVCSLCADEHQAINVYPPFPSFHPPILFFQQTLIGKWKGIERAADANAGGGGSGTKKSHSSSGVSGDGQQLILSGDTLVFDKGQKCWNGPARSLRVALACGPEDELSAVAEPETCTYTAVLETPAACSPALRDALVASSRVGEEEEEKEEGGGASRRADAGVEGEL